MADNRDDKKELEDNSENKDIEENKEDKKDKKGITLSIWQVVLIIIIIILLLLAGTCTGRNWNKWFGGDNGGDNIPTDTSTVVHQSSRNPGDPDIDPNASEWTGSLPNDDNSSQSEGIKIPGYPAVKIPADKTDVQMLLLNPEGNPCYFIYEITLKDTDETLYQSKMVPPGKSINNITLSRPLEKGRYKAIVKISTASLTDLTPLNGANLETELIVE